MSPASSSPTAAKVAGLQAVLTRLRNSAYKVPPLPEGSNALERMLALILQDGGPYSVGENAVKALKKRFAHWNEVRVARQFEVKDALSRSRIAKADHRAELAQQFLRRIFGLQNHLELDWLYDATSERRQKLLTSLQMADPMVGPVLDLDAQEEPDLLITTNLKRLLSRLTLIPSSPKDSQARELVEVEVTEKNRYANSIALEVHAASVCDSKHPHCRQCILLDTCPHGKRQLGTAGTKAALIDLGLAKGPAKKKTTKKTAAKKTTKKKTAKKKTTKKGTTRGSKAAAR